MSSTRRTLAAMLLHRTKDFRQLRNVESRRNCLRSAEHTNWYPIRNGHTGIFLQSKEVVFNVLKKVSMCMCM